MDTISCFLTFESYNYNRNNVEMIWNQPNPVLIFKETIELPEFSMVNYSIGAVQQVLLNLFLTFKSLISN